MSAHCPVRILLVASFVIHLEFLPEIVCKVGKVCKVEKPRSTFHTFHDYLNFCGEKKDGDIVQNVLMANPNQQMFYSPYGDHSIQ